MPLDIQPLPAVSINTKWKEPYASSSLNRRPVGITPPGIYRGLVLGTDPLEGDRTVSIITDPDKGDHVAVFENEDGFSVNYRDGSSGDITVSLNAYVSTDVVVCLFVNYAVGVTTEGFFRTYTQGEFNGLTASFKATLVVLGTVSVPASGPIVADDIALSGRTLASSNLQRGTVQNPPLARNQSFEIGETGQTVRLSSRFWEKNTTGGSGAWNTSTDRSNKGTKSIQVTVSSGPFTGEIVQQAGIETTPGEIFPCSVFVWQDKTISSGDFEFFMEFSDSNGDLLSTSTQDLDGGSVDGDWREVNPIIAAPLGASALRAFGVRCVAMDPSSTGSFGYIDSVGVFVEPLDAKLPYAFDQRFRQRLSASALLLMDEDGGFDDPSADITYDQSSPAGEGSLVLESEVSTDKPPAMSIPGRLFELGERLLASGTDARKPRVFAKQADGAESLYTLMWESKRGATQATRFYVKDDGSMNLVVNAIWDGANWNKDDGAGGAVRMVLNGDSAVVDSTDSGTGTWGDGAWTQATFTSGIPGGIDTILGGSDVTVEENLAVLLDMIVTGTMEGKQGITLGEDLKSTDLEAETPRIFVDRVADATSERTLIAEFRGVGYHTRMYSTGYNSDSFEITTNARWDDSANLWLKDSGSNNSSQYIFNRNQLEFRHRGTTDNWDDGITASGWENGYLKVQISSTSVLTLGGTGGNASSGRITLYNGMIEFNSQGTTSNPLKTDDITNELRALNIVKAWAYITVGSQANAVYTDGFNIDGIFNSGGYIGVNIGASIGNTDYAVVLGSYVGTGGVGWITSKSSASFITNYAYTGPEINPQSLMFIICGRQTGG